MSWLTLRARVAAAAGVAIVVGVVVLGIAVLARLDDQLRGDLDRTLRGRAVEVARLSASTPRLLTAPGALEGRLGGSALFVQVVDRRGRLVARSGGLGGRVLPQGCTSAAPGTVTTSSARTGSVCTPRRLASWARALRRAAR